MLLQQQAPPATANTLLDDDVLRLRAIGIRDQLTHAGLYVPQTVGNHEIPEGQRWRVGAEPFTISLQEHAFLESLGPRLQAFVRACHTLYLKSISGKQPAWIAEYLDLGKPPELVAFSRMRRLRGALPTVIRPDIIPTDNGFMITELDSVPGGIGLTAALIDAYSKEALPSGNILQNCMIDGFADMIRAATSSDNTSDTLTVAIVVSEEAKDYRPEMTWLAARLRKTGLDVYTVTPREVQFTEDGLTISIDGSTRPITVLYRFFELFDMKNVPKTELIMYSTKKGGVTVTPPFKPWLEEKMWFAFFHHPALIHFWVEELGEEPVAHLHALIPKTWILDPRRIPPHATIPHLTVAGRPVQHWNELKAMTQKERRLVIKPSGFSPLAWGSRGVSIGHDLPQEEWVEALDSALDAFFTTPYILQEFHTGRRVTLPYYDQGTETIQRMPGRTRLCPYYFVRDEDVRFGGTLATICSLDKKLIHGMKDAILVPCAVKGNT